MSDVVRARINGTVVQLPLEASAGDALSAVPSGGWVGITAEDGSIVGLVADEDLRGEGPDTPLAAMAVSLPPLVAVNADAAPADAIGSPAFRSLVPRQPVLVEEGGAPLGVWAGQDLAEQVVSHGSTRFATDVGLNGQINIAVVRLICKYREELRCCLAPRTFPELPDRLPQCENPRHMSAHLFTL
jgi:hypothetical protein